MKKKKTSPKTLVLLDAHAIIHRAYHALPSFTTAAGIPTGALYGTLAFIIKVLKDLKPDYIAACYDLPGGTFRHEAFERYKAGRAEADTALIDQLERSRSLVAALGIPIYDHPGFEADDMLGTIVSQIAAAGENIDIIIASGDMDTLQLVDGTRVRVYTLRRGLQDTVIYDENTVKARYGFAPKLLVDYKGLRGDPSDNIPGVPGIGEKIATQLIATFGPLVKIYATLKKDQNILIEKGIKKGVVKLLIENEHGAFFSRELAEIRRDAPIVFSVPEKPWFETLDLAIVEALCDELEFRTLKLRLRELVLARRNLSSAAHPQAAELGEETDSEDIRSAALMLWVVHSDMTNPTRADILAFTGVKTIAEAERILHERIVADNLEEVYERIEVPLTPVLREAEEHGVLIDRAYLAGLSREYHSELASYERKIWDIAGEEFNINSPRQLGAVLFDTLGLLSRKRTAGGARSTSGAALLNLRGTHPIIDEIISYREVQKLLSTYIDVIPKLLDGHDRLHTTFDQAGTTTGRLASRDPNLQNIPIRTERGRVIRRAFIVPSGCTLVACDYSQLELRIAAMLSGDEKMMTAFREGLDFHTMVAAETFGVSQDAVTKDMRRKAKIINFGILYGMGVSALAKASGSTRAEASLAYERYREQFKTLFSYFERVKNSARECGYTTTLFGRRRYFADITSPTPHIRAAAERMAVNAPIQGTEADIIKHAMIRIRNRFAREGLSDAALLLQVHDELVYEVPNANVQHAIRIIIEEMEGVVRGGVRFASEAYVGKNWGELAPYSL